MDDGNVALADRDVAGRLAIGRDGNGIILYGPLDTVLGIRERVLLQHFEDLSHVDQDKSLVDANPVRLVCYFL